MYVGITITLRRERKEAQEFKAGRGLVSILSPPIPKGHDGICGGQSSDLVKSPESSVWGHHPCGPEAGSHTGVLWRNTITSAFPSCVLWAGTGYLHGHMAQPGMGTLHLAEKWAEAGGAIVDTLELPLLPDSSDRKAQLAHQRQRRLPQEGLNSLPKQMKAASAWSCSVKRRQGRGRKWFFLY